MKVRRLRNDELCHTNVRRLRDDELYHHGIKGQRWGIRRYQNEDGTLTEAGRIRYNYLFDEGGNARISKKELQARTKEKGMSNALIRSSAKRDLSDYDFFESIAKEKRKANPKKKGLTIDDIDDDELVDLIMLEKDPKVFKEYNIDESTYNKWKKKYDKQYALKD